jgi:hypothetical protein
VRGFPGSEDEAGVEDLGGFFGGVSALGAPLAVLLGFGDGLTEEFGLAGAGDAGLDGGLVAAEVGGWAPLRADRGELLVQALVSPAA